MPQSETPRAWERIIKRPPKCVDWSEREITALVDERQAPRTIEIVRKIGYRELMRSTSLGSRPRRAIFRS